MNSFIPWVGGKSQLRRSINSFFPENNIDRYIEVFGGAGWILFSKDRHAPIEIFNDLDGHLINLYRCIRCHCKELQHELQRNDFSWLPTSRELFFDYKEQLNLRGLTDIQRAARYFYIIRASYGADRDSFGCKKVPFKKSIDRLPEIAQRLQNVLIENNHFERILKTYDRPKSLFYLDPPYCKAEGYYEGFLYDDHAKLCSILKGLKGRFVLSYNDHPDIRKLYKDFHIHEVSRAHFLTAKHGGQTPKYHELIITNYTAA